MDVSRDEAVHTIAHEFAHAYLNAQGDPDHQRGGGYDAEVKADKLVLTWGFDEPPDRAKARERYRVTTEKPARQLEPAPQNEEVAIEERIICTVRRQWNDCRTVDVPLDDEGAASGKML